MPPYIGDQCDGATRRRGPAEGGAGVRPGGPTRPTRRAGSSQRLPNSQRDDIPDQLDLRPGLQDQRVVPGVREPQFQALVAVLLHHGQPLQPPEPAQVREFLPGRVQRDVGLAGRGSSENKTSRSPRRSRNAWSPTGQVRSGSGFDGSCSKSQIRSASSGISTLER
jgi:hypothetical protein